MDHYFENVSTKTLVREMYIAMMEMKREVDALRKEVDDMKEKLEKKADMDRLIFEVDEVRDEMHIIQHHLEQQIKPPNDHVH